MKKAFIYKITSPIGKIYIGSTMNVYKRIYQYRFGSQKRQVKIFNSIKKYGWDQHKFELILVTTEDSMCHAESILGNFFNCLDKQWGLNLRLPKSGDLVSISDETRIKIGLANKGKVPHFTTIENSRKARIGKTIPQNVRDKISIGNMGKIMSDVVRQKIREKHIGKKATLEARQKMSAAKKGKPPHPNSLSQLKILKKGDKRPPEHFAAMHQARKKLVINMDTGIFYDSAAEALLSITHIKDSCFREMMRGVNPNRTSFIYA
jgi:group I intron endonuclease